MRIALYGRLAVALVGAAFALACSAILDTDGLSNSWSGTPDSSGQDSWGQDLVKDTKPVPMDFGTCVPGKACTIPTALGECAKGISTCTEGGDGFCKPRYAKKAETCDGKDEDCDGNADAKDLHAHAACGTGKYCTGSACAQGCYSAADCGSSADTCTSHTCRCGTSGPCSGPNPTCSSGKCICDKDSTCKANETCKSGVCYCGASKGSAAGPYCSDGSCDPAKGSCGTPPDLGPDKGPPVDKGPTPDQPVTTPDQKVQPDQNVQPDQAPPVDQAAPTQ
jgi:hypothetical protein